MHKADLIYTIIRTTVSCFRCVWYSFSQDFHFQTNTN